MMSSRAVVAAQSKLRLILSRSTPTLSSASASATPTRFYSTTPPVFKKKDDDKGNNKNGLDIYGDISPADAEKIVQEELEKLQQFEDDKYLVPPEDWKPGQRKRKLVIGRDLEEFYREMYPDRYEAKWTLRDRRCGALAIKVGMMPVWDPIWGERIPTTVLFVDTNVVLGHKTQEKNGYVAVQLAAGERKRKNVGKCVLGQYKDLLQGDPFENPPYLTREFRISDEAHLPPLNSRIHARHFVPGQNVDISGISKGKGFQGGMKLHGFGGMPASHGVSKSHRSLGSTGQCQDPGRVFKGKKMAGRMGTNRVTVQNLQVVKIDRGRNLIYVKGHVPGQKGNWVEIRDAVKRPLWNTDRVEGGLDRPPLPTYDYESEEDGVVVDGCGEKGYEVFMPIGKEDPLDPDYRNTVQQIKADD